MATVIKETLMEFDPTQLKAIEGATEAVKNGTPYYRIGGYAGTGKTTIAMYIANQTGLHYRGAAFMGKAASQLRKKGIKQSATLHRTMYDWDDDHERFRRKQSIDCQLLILDEGSTVPTDLWIDIKSFRVPIIVLGDPGQLEPIGEDAKLMNDPNIILEHIHRYEGSIAWFANQVRLGHSVPRMMNDEVQVKSKGVFLKDLFDDPPSVVLCGFNKTRVACNRQIREKKYGQYCASICDDERLICLRNDYKIGCFNGQMINVIQIVREGHSAKTGKYVIAKVQFDGEEITRNVKLWHGHLNKEKPVDWKKIPKGACVVDYGYATTVHKFQGSEEEDVMVIDEQCDLWSPVRHRYTAYTRAQKRLRVYID